MRFLFLLLIIFLFSNVHAQFPFGGQNQTATLKGKIEGEITDSITLDKIPFATITLKKINSSVDFDGTLSDDAGRFKFENVKTGKYNVEISFLGYKTKFIKEIETTLKNPDVDLGQIFMTSLTTNLENVVVKEKRALVENKVDRLVYNAENDASIAGGDATDVLRKVPLLSVDLNGNVSIRGSQNVRILINGKPSGMFNTNIGDALKMFPADQIKRVEVITAPSAKFDAEGSGGIINIVTSKQNIEGVAGNINTSIGTRQNSLFTSLNAGKGRLGSSTSFAIFYSNPADGNISFDRSEIVDGVSKLFTQRGSQTTSRLGGNGNASLFYDFNGYHSINSSVNFRGFGFDIDGNVNGKLTEALFIDEYNKANQGDNFNGGFDWNTDYTMKFEKHKDRELSFAFQFTNDNNNQDFDVQEQHSYLTEINRDVKIFNDGNNNEYTSQVDYVHPLKGGKKLEIGAKSVFRRIISDYQNSLKNEQGQYSIIPEFTNIFNYNQDILATYASFNFIIRKKWNVISGVRYENTKIKGTFEDDNTSDFSNDYGNILPSITISQNLSNFRSVKLSYTQRIQRPSLSFINPFVNNTDFLNRVIGNPQLDPELTHQIELGYNTNFKGFAIFSTVYYKYTKDIIDQTIMIDSLISINSFQNIGQNKSVGLNLFTSKTIKKLTLRGGGNVFTYNGEGIVNGVNLSRETYEYNLFFNGEYVFTSKLKADFFGFFKSPRRSLQGDNPSFSIYGMGIRREFKNSSIGISMIEPFSQNKIFATELKGPDFSQRNEFTLPFRSFGINFRYKFGNVDFKERKAKIKNNDLKSSESDVPQNNNVRN